MSTPARKIVTPPRGIPTPPRGAPTKRQRPSPAPSRPVGPARRASARRGVAPHLGFALLAGTLVGCMVFGIVVLHVLLAQTSFRIDRAERAIEELSDEHLTLVREQATLSAPGRIAAWARRHGMRLPDDIRILHARSPCAAV